MKFDPKNALEIKKTSKVGALLHLEKYEDFEKAITKAENKADLVGELDLLVAQKIEASKDIKRVVDAAIKPIKVNFQNIRDWTAKYMADNNIQKLEGTQIKSVTVTGAKTVKGTISKKQIMVKRKYVNIDDLSKDDLVELLEENGVKTRIQTEEVETTSKPSIRINK